MKRSLAEFLGTFLLVFAGAGAVVIDDVSGGRISHLGVALTFGLAVTALIYTLGEVSGAHLNPAVSVGFWIAGRFPRRDLMPYLFSQCAGGVSASALLRLLFPGHPTLGATLPAGPPSQSFLLEIVLAFFLMFVVINVSTGAKEKGVTAGVAVGAAVGLAALFAGPVSGASMNPARSLGPALLSGETGSLWIYLTAPFIGAALGIAGCRLIQVEGCCIEKEEGCR